MCKDACVSTAAEGAHATLLGAAPPAWRHIPELMGLGVEQGAMGVEGAHSIEYSECLPQQYIVCHSTSVGSGAVCGAGVTREGKACEG